VRRGREVLNRDFERTPTSKPETPAREKKHSPEFRQSGGLQSGGEPPADNVPKGKVAGGGHSL